MGRNKRRKRPMKVPPIAAKARLEPADKLYLVLFWTILFCAIALLIYRADYAGMTHDESKSFKRYSVDVHTATHRFDSTNNHILNSIFMHYSQKLFGSYEQFIRIPSVTAGAIFMLAASYILSRTIRSKPLILASLLLMCFSKSFYNYLFMARGYAYALSSLMVYIAFVLFLLSHKVRFRYWPMVAILFSLINFIAIGSLLSSVLIMCAVNGAFVLFYSPQIFRDISGRLKPMIVMFLSILGTTALMLHFLFRDLYAKLFSLEGNYDLVGLVNKWDGWPSLSHHLNMLLKLMIFDYKTVSGRAVFYILACIILISLLFYLYRVFRSFKLCVPGEFFSKVQPITFLLASTFLSLAVLFIYGVVLGRCPGLIRSNILLSPLATICSLCLIGWFVDSVVDSRYGKLLHIAVAVVILSLFLQTAPRFHSPVRNLMAKPVLKKLQAYNPAAVWSIGFSKKMWTYHVGFLYYDYIDYRFRILRDLQRCNVYICNSHETPEGAVLLDSDYFSPWGYSVVLNVRSTGK